MRNVTMHTLLKSILTVVAAALIAAPAYGHSAPAAATGTGWKEMELRYPGSDAVVLYDHISKRRHRAVMLFTDNAINRYGDPRILFNAATQDLAILAARVRMRDGSIVEVRKNAVNQTTPFALDLTPDYVDWQETVVTLMGIEKGCIAELHYVIADKNPSPYLSGVEVFSAEDPAEERVLVVKVPPGMTLKFASMNGGSLEPDTGTNGTWAWTLHRLYSGIPFAGGVWEGDYAPSVCYSTASTWHEALAPIGRDIRGKAKSVPPVLSRMIEEKTKDCMTPEDEVLTVQRLAIECVRTVAAPFPLLASSPRDVARIYDSGYANALDRAVLLKAMLQDAGFGSSVVFVSAGSAPIDSLPAPELCPSVAVALHVYGAGELLLDPSTPLEHDPAFSLAGRTLVYLDSEPRLVHLPGKSNPDSKSGLILSLTPRAEGGFEGKGTAILKGAFSPYYLVREGKNGLENFLKNRVAGFFGGTELVSWNPRSLERNEAEFDFTFTVNLPAKKKGERVYLAMPKPLESGLSGIERVPGGRSQIFVGIIRIERCTLDVSCAIRLPEGWRMITAPYSTIEQGGPGEASAGFEQQADGTHLFMKHVLFYVDRVYAIEFGEFRSLINTFGEDRIVFEKE